MKQIVIKAIYVQNFKKFEEKLIELGGSINSILGQNYKGKSSIADAFSWVMFGKSSTGNAEGSQFRPRRYDENGKNVDHVDVAVELVLVVDGEEVKVRKTQRQKWVRHKGDDFDSYMGDETLYEWNDVPTTATAHKAKVEEIISEDIFRMISNPATFPSLPWKKQREFLTKNIANITNEDVFALYPGFADVKEAMGSKTLDELAAKTKKEITALSKKQEEIPVRIDQESKRISDIDFSELEKELATLQNELVSLENRIEDSGKGYELVNTLKAEKAQIEGKIAALQADFSGKRQAEKAEIELAINAATTEFNKAFNQQKETTERIEILENAVETKQKRLNDLMEEFRAETVKTVDENSYICPVCGQELPEVQKEAVLKEFKQKQLARIEEINSDGKLLSGVMKSAKAEIAECEKLLEELKTKKADAIAKKNRLEIDLKVFDTPADYTSITGYVALVAEKEVVEKQIAAIDTTDADTLKAQLKAEREAVQVKIDGVKEKLALKAVIEQSKQAVEELKSEMKEVTKKLADRERLESQIDKFNRAKMDLLSEKINDKFQLVEWKLFEKLKTTGKYTETCVCMLNGSAYGDNTTSATERMMCGMDIIRTLQSIYEVQAPIFLDDADLYNRWNIPSMDCQLIKLCVSEDAELRIEREE